MTDEILRDKFVGSMLGCGIGDSLGTFAFHRTAKNLINLNENDSLTHTDDTAMAIGLAESLAVKRCVDEKHLGDRFRSNYRREPNRGYASSAAKIFDLVEAKGMSYSKRGRLPKCSLVGRDHSEMVEQ